MDAALVSRVVTTPGVCGDRFSQSTSALKLVGAPRLPLTEDLVAWWTTPEALAVEAALRDAASVLPLPLSFVVLDLLNFYKSVNVRSTLHVRHRQVFVDAAEPRDALVLPVPHGADSAAGDAWIELDDGSEPSALLVQHRFRLADGRELTLRTLLFGDTMLMTPADFGRVAFGSAPVAVQPLWEAEPQLNAPPATAVALDGVGLTAAQLAALPKATRDALQQCRSAQLVVTLRDILAHRWPGGYSMLRKRVMPFVSHAAKAAIEALAAVLVLARTGGRETYQLMHICLRRAEFLEADGRPLEAAGLYKLNLATQIRFKDYDDPSQSWVNLGLALTDAHDYTAAVQALRRALEANNAAMPPSEDNHLDCQRWFTSVRRRNAAAREVQRLRVLDMLLVALESSLRVVAGAQHSDMAPYSAVVLELLAPYVVEGVDVVLGDSRLEIQHTSGKFLRATALHSGTTFVLCRGFTPLLGEHSFWVERVPAGAPLPSATSGRAEACATRGGSDEAFVAHRNTQSQRLPRLPPSVCAQCGATVPNMKLCGICKQIAYCGADCQMAHWRAGHKRACRAMAAEAQAEAQAEAETQD